MKTGTLVTILYFTLCKCHFLYYIVELLLPFTMYIYVCMYGLNKKASNIWFSVHLPFAICLTAYCQFCLPLWSMMRRDSGAGVMQSNGHNRPCFQ